MNNLDKVWANRTPKAFKGKHPDWYWVQVTIPMTRKEVLEHFGTKCKTFEKGCGCCDAWRSWEKNGRVKVIVERTTCLEPWTGCQRR